jgi:hypothetical protein
MSKQVALITVIVFAAVLAGGCNRAKDSAQVAKDVDSAAQAAAERNAKAEDKAVEKIDAARTDVRGEMRDAAHVAAVQEQNLATTDAEGARKIALAKCEALGGENQKICKDQANADYGVALAEAKQDRAETDPKQ